MNNEELKKQIINGFDLAGLTDAQQAEIIERVIDNVYNKINIVILDRQPKTESEKNQLVFQVAKETIDEFKKIRDSQL